MSSVGAPTPSTSTAGGETAVRLPLRVKKAIRERYDPDAATVLNQARALTAMPELNFVPNFEHNYALLAAFDATLDRNDGEDDAKLSEYWQEQLGQMTLEYLQGFVDECRGEGFKKDDLQQEAFREIVSRGVLEVRILEGDEVNKIEGPCDCVAVDGALVIRTSVEKWGVATSRCCEGLIGLL